MPKMKIFLLTFIVALLINCGGYNFKYKKQNITYKNLDYGFNVKYADLGSKFGKVAYVDEGQGEKTIVLIHGVGTYIKHWEYQIRPLKEKYRVIALDMPGYGKTGYSKNVNYSVKYHSQAVSALIKKLKLKNVILVGHSYGGNVVTDLTSYNDIDLKGIVLIAPQGLQKFKKNDLNYYDNNLKNLVKFDFDINANIQVWFDFLIKKRSKITDKFLREMLGLINSGDYRDTAAVRQRVILEQHKTRYIFVLINKFLKFPKPILFIIGEDDKIVPGFVPSMMRAPTPQEYFVPFTKKNKNCKLILIENCGHMVPIEYPDKLSEMIDKFASKN